MRYLSLFSGIGGFELGIQQAHELPQLGTEPKNSTDTASRTPQHAERPFCIGYSEIDKYATQIYKKHFPEHKEYGDITKIKAEDLPDFDLLCGGFPCQSFSIAGKRGGFNDTRGTMFFEIARILRAKQPRLLLLENVKGLLSHDQGKTFATIISTLDELGYDCQWQVLNSKNFGVPQNRERVFIVGHLRDQPRPQVFPFTTNGESSDELPRHVTNTLTRRYEGAQDEEGLSPTLNTMQGGNRQPFIQQRPRGNNKGGEHEIVPTISSNSWQDNNHLVKEMKIRRLTPIECERLQSFPDGWTEGLSDTQRYKCLGNAVTVKVIEAIMSNLLKHE